MIFAKVDVILPRHPRILQIPRGTRRAAALGAFAAALCYAREHETDGVVPLAALDGFTAPQTVADLSACGLFTVADGYATIRNYAGKNETKAQIDERRSGTAMRVARFREKRVSNALQPGASNAFVPGSGSGSHSGSDQDLGESAERGTAAGWSGPPASLELTDAFRLRCFEAGAPEPTRDHAEAFLASARASGKMAVDWLELFFAWMIREKKFRASAKRPAPGFEEHEQTKRRIAERPDPVIADLLAAKRKAGT